MAVEQMSEETSKELATTLRSLDVTMRQHMTILKKSKDTLLASMGKGGRQTSLPSAAAPNEAVTARAIELRGDKSEEIVEVTRNRKVTVHSFILHIEHLYSACPRKLLRGVPSSSTTQKSSLKVEKCN